MDRYIKRTVEHVKHRIIDIRQTCKTHDIMYDSVD